MKKYPYCLNLRKYDIIYKSLKLMQLRKFSAPCFLTDNVLRLMILVDLLQVFGRLILTNTSEADKKDEVDYELMVSMDHSDNDLKEHMVGILFSRSKLTHLQKQVSTRSSEGQE